MKKITLDVATETRTQMLDITEKVQEAVTRSGVNSGACYLFVPHTTAAVTVNEKADPAVREDITGYLNKLVPHHSGYQHAEGNSDAHIKASLTGSDSTLLVEEGRLLLGTWQGIFFCQFDGPRKRKLCLKVLPG